LTLKTANSSTDPKASGGRDNVTWASKMGQSGEYVGLGLQLAGSVLLYVGLGFWLDRWLDTSPWFLLGGALLGMVAFFVQIVRVVRRMNKETARHLEEIHDRKASEESSV